MADLKQISVRISAEVAEDITLRMDSLRGVANSVVRSLETGDPRAATDAITALSALSAEVGRIMVDLDVCAWTLPKVRQRS